MKPLDLRGRRVLITGASSGLGASFARRLAHVYGARPLLVARREDRLRALAAELAFAQPEVFVEDLAREGGCDALLDAVDKDPPFAAILNAAAYDFGDFTALTRERLEHLLALNVAAVARLSHGLLRGFDARGEGGLLLVASTGGFMPAPGQALYAGTKAFVCNFALSLHHERGQHIPVCLCAPGGMPTEMINESGVMERLRRHPLVMRSFLEPEAVAAEALAGFVARRALTVPGRLNRAIVALAGVLPHGLLGRGVKRVYR